MPIPKRYRLPLTAFVTLAPWLHFKYYAEIITVNFGIIIVCLIALKSTARTFIFKEG